MRSFLIPSASALPSFGCGRETPKRTNHDTVKTQREKLGGFGLVGWGYLKRKSQNCPKKDGTFHPRNAQQNSLKKPNEDTWYTTKIHDTHVRYLQKLMFHHKRLANSPKMSDNQAVQVIELAEQQVEPWNFLHRPPPGNKVLKKKNALRKMGSRWFIFPWIIMKAFISVGWVDFEGVTLLRFACYVHH